MIAFADASALVTLYADEEDHEVVRSLTDLVVAEISRAEVVAALWRTSRAAEITAEQASVLVRGFVTDDEGSGSEEPRFDVVVTAASLVRDAALLCGRHPLRAYDAVQLASALLAAQVGGEAVTMVAFDQQLHTAAVREGLSLLP